MNRLPSALRYFGISVGTRARNSRILYCSYISFSNSSDTSKEYSYCFVFNILYICIINCSENIDMSSITKPRYFLNRLLIIEDLNLFIKVKSIQKKLRNNIIFRFITYFLKYLQFETSKSFLRACLSNVRPFMK